jgi:hypothetical protein
VLPLVSSGPLFNRWDSVVSRSLGASTFYGREVPIEDVAASDLRAGDVVRLEDPQAHRVERVARDGRRVVLELRPVGLEVSETVRVMLPVDRLVSRLGSVLN